MFCCKSTEIAEIRTQVNDWTQKHPLTCQEDFRSLMEQFDLHTWRGKEPRTYLLMPVVTLILLFPD